MEQTQSQMLRESALHPVSQTSPTPGTTPVNNSSGGGVGATTSASNNNSSSNNNISMSSSSCSGLNISINSNGLSALAHGPSALAAHAAHAAAVAAAHAAHNQALGVHGTHHHLHGHHANPLNLISKSLVSSKPHPGSYSSPPPVACHPENNVCKLIEYRGAKVAAFIVDGRELICLPQAFELFLKHLVGGLHTVYTKLKRLDIAPVVCNVEQVRILRGLGAIQPGVNRCKLISCKEFDVLYDDCTNSSARPGRPPKRSPSIHASPETIEKLKKSRIDGGDFQFDPRLYGEHKSMLNGFPPHPYALAPLPFLPLGHPMMSPPVTMAMATHLGLRPDSAVVAKDRSAEQEILARHRDERLASLNAMYGAPPLADHHLSQRHLDIDPNKPLNLQINGHLKDTAKHSGIMRSEDEDDGLDDDKLSDEEHEDEMDDSMDMADGYGSMDLDKQPTGGSHVPGAGLHNGDVPSMPSIETLLLNIQGLIKVATDTLRHQERQTSQDKAELKMELMRERDLRQSIEKQLFEEQRNRVNLQRRLRKEKKARRRFQDQAESAVSKGGMGRNTPSTGLDLAVKPPASPESPRNHHAAYSYADAPEPDTDGEKGCSLPPRERNLSESPDRVNNHRDMFDVFSAAAAAAAHTVTSGIPGGSPVRFPAYLSLVPNEVQ